MNGDLQHALARRFGEDFNLSLDDAQAEKLAALASHRVQRDFQDRPVDPELLKALCACALSAPSKSDLQQRDLVIVEDRDLRARIGALMPHYPWVASAPAMVIFCLNGRRLPKLSEWRGKPFPNDHFDLLFNAATDAAIALGWFQLAVEMAGLGGCPVSEFRNHAALISDWLGLPDRVAIYAGFCLGWPAADPQISPRLPLSTTLHYDRFSDASARAEIERYDAARAAAQPTRRQRDTARWGEADTYTWSEDKARQYAEPLRTDFGAYLRARKFNFD
jgi:nitroreductase